MNLERGCLLFVSPITSPTGGLLMSIGYTKVNSIMFFILSVCSFPFSFIKIEQTYGISELNIISHVWKQFQVFITCHHNHLWLTLSKYPLQCAGFQLFLTDLKLSRQCFLFSCCQFWQGICFVFYTCFGQPNWFSLSPFFSYCWQMCISGSPSLFHTLFPLATEILGITHRRFFLAGLLCRTPRSVTGICGWNKLQCMSQFTRAFWYMVVKLHQLMQFDLGIPK